MWDWHHPFCNVWILKKSRTHDRVRVWGRNINGLSILASESLNGAFSITFNRLKEILQKGIHYGVRVCTDFTGR